MKVKKLLKSFTDKKGNVSCCVPYGKFIYLFAIHVRKLPTAQSVQRRTVRMTGDYKMSGMWKEAVVAFVGPVPAFPWNK